MVDAIKPFLIEGSDVRGRFVRLDDSTRAIIAKHDYPAPVKKLMSEALGLTAAMAGVLKFDGILTVQIKGDGPVSLMVCDAVTDGDGQINLRGYARFDADALAGKDSFDALVGTGYLAFTVDQGKYSERYQGIVELSPVSLVDSVLTYFKQSDQFLMALRLASDDDGRVAAMTLQRLPTEGGTGGTNKDIEDADDAWNRATVLMDTVTDAELLGPDLDQSTVLFRLFHEDGVRVFDDEAVRDQCRCSAERLANVLVTLTAEDLDAAQNDAGAIEANCEFCNTTYSFAVSDIEAAKAA